MADAAALPRRAPGPAHTGLTSVGGLAMSLLLVAVVAGLGAWSNAGSVDGWYANADKPAGTPPGAVFGPVWTTLYAAMAVAGWLVWRRYGFDGARTALALYAVQLALNASWSPVFFAGQYLVGGAVVIVALDLSVAATIAAFARRHRIAALLLVPYLGWVVYATYLNVGIAVLN